MTGNSTEQRESKAGEDERNHRLCKSIDHLGESIRGAGYLMAGGLVYLALMIGPCDSNTKDVNIRTPYRIDVKVHE